MEKFLIDNLRLNFTKDEILGILPYYDKSLKLLYSPFEIDKLYDDELTLKNVNTILTAYRHKTFQTLDEWHQFENTLIDEFAMCLNLICFQVDDLIHNSSEILYYCDEQNDQSRC